MFMKFRLLAGLGVLLLLAAGAGAYDIQLDIDLDDDPWTLNTETDEDTAQVRIVLAPTLPDEWITEIGFGLGGTCWDCSAADNAATYGTEWDLMFAVDWLDHPLFESSDVEGATCISCCGNPGWHLAFFAYAAGGGFTLSEPIFIRDFTAWVSRDDIFDICPHPPADLMTFPDPFGGQGGPGNIIQIGNDEFPVRRSAWSQVKALY